MNVYWSKLPYFLSWQSDDIIIMKTKGTGILVSIVAT